MLNIHNTLFARNVRAYIATRAESGSKGAESALYDCVVSQLQCLRCCRVCRWMAAAVRPLAACTVALID